MDESRPDNLPQPASTATIYSLSRTPDRPASNSAFGNLPVAVQLCVSIENGPSGRLQTDHRKRQHDAPANYSSWVASSPSVHKFITADARSSCSFDPSVST